MSAEYLLQDSRSLTGDRLMFWAKGGSYTSNLDVAERFTMEQAVSQNSCRETDLPWPLEYVLARHELAVDHQDVHPDQVSEALAIETEAYLSIPRCWNGNDLIWLTGDGKHSADLGEAAVYPMATALSGSVQGNGLRAIPKNYADALARKVAPSPNVAIKHALIGTGIKLENPRKSAKYRYNCDKCGSFMSEAQRYSSCPKCQSTHLL